MKQELYDLGERVIRMAKSAGADGCRVAVDSERQVSISYRDRKPENIKEALTKSLAAEVFVGGRYAVQRTSDLRPEALKGFLESAVASAKLLAEDPFRSLPDPKYYQGRAALDLQLVDPAYESLTPDERHRLVREVEAGCLARGGDKVISVQASTRDSYYESALMASNGLEGYSAATAFFLGVSMTAKDQGDRRPSDFATAVAIRRKALPRPEDLGAEAAERTLQRLGAKKIKTETMPIIVENRIVESLGDGLVQAMFGRSIQQKQSFLADKKGQPVGSPLLTVIDDPLIPGGLGSQLYDGDGFAAVKRTMFDAGVLKDFYVDWYYSRKLGWEPTTAAPSNLIVPPGRRSVADIMRDLGRGILITGFIGGNSNSTTGDMSVGIVGRLFEGGAPVQAVAEMNIADNHLKFWPKLVEAANDPYPYSPARVPSLVFKDVVVSGV